MSPSNERVSPVDGAVGSIVVAVDGSEHAARALRWGADQAALEHRRVVVVSVGEDADAELFAEDAVAAARDRHPDLDLHGSAVPGDPRQVLIDLAEVAHVLVVGSRGRGALRGMLLGSVSAAVSSHAACPVVVCRPPAEQARHGVVVGADGTRESLPVIEFAYRQAALRGLPLTVLHCFWDAVAAVAQYRQATGRPAGVPELEDLRAVLAESVAGLAEKYPDVPVHLTLEHGLVDEALSPRHEGWDLVVVGRHPMTSHARLLTGSVSRAVLERARSTVAVVPEQAHAT
jgi:nucleotide-binding universal stress UspA family protein